MPQLAILNTHVTPRGLISDYGSNEFPTAKNLGLDTKMKSLANLEPSQWETHDFILFLVLAEEFLSCNKNYSLNKS